jgi:sugar lactone lactonase YvrE
MTFRLGVLIVGVISAVATGRAQRILPLAAPPRIDAVSPAQGPIAGGFEVRIAGTGFTGATVRLDDTPVTPTSQSDTEVRLRMPEHANGFVVLSIRSSAAAAYGEFLYVPPRLQDLPAGYITTVAGMGPFVRDYGPATSATVFPAGLALDRDGTLYVAEPSNDRVSRIRTDGTIERVTARVSGPIAPGTSAGDGAAALDAPVLFPLSIAVDPNGNVYIPDQNGRIRRVDGRTSIITTIAGDGRREYSGDDGPAVNARFAWPTHIAADDDDVFVVDFSASRIRRIDLANGRITTFVGTGSAGYSGDNGPGTLAQFNMGDADSGHLALDRDGHLFVADTDNYRIRRVDRRSGVITTFYALPRSSGRDFVGRARSIAFDEENNVYVGGASRVIKVSARGEFVGSWGSGTYTLPVEGSSADQSGLGLVTGLAITAGNIYYTDGAVNRVRRIEIESGRLYTVAGIGPSIVGEEGPAVATVVRPWDVAADRDGNILIADDGRVRRLDRNGIITTVAGTGSSVGRALPAAAREAVTSGFGLNADDSGAIELTNWSTIDRVDTDGVVRTIAGRNGVCSYTGDGEAATLATLCQAWDSVRDRDGHLLIADSNNNRIRRVGAQTNLVTTVVGNGGPVSGYERYNNGRSCGDGGPAVDACINTPYGVAVDAAGNLYLSERPAIRKVDRGGIITTFAPIANTTKLVFDRAGNLYAGVIAGIFRLDTAGRQTWIAGQGGSITQSGFSGDGGPASLAKVRISSQSAGIAIDADGNVYFTDNGRIRAVRSGTR